MNRAASDVLKSLIVNEFDAILKDWLQLQSEALSRRRDLLNDADLDRDSRRMLESLRAALSSEGEASLENPAWRPLRESLAALSRGRALLGFSPSETATFVLSLKQPLFRRVQERFAQDAAGMARESWRVTQVVDMLGLWTTEEYQRAREEVISSQQQELIELSTPVVRLWDGVLAVPLIGTLDSSRTQVVMENLLQEIVRTGAMIAIMDITGVPTVDTLVAQHLLKTVAAARLMGADCIISGIRPAIAQTIVHLGVDLEDVTTKATLADAFATALKRLGLAVTRS